MSQGSSSALHVLSVDIGREEHPGDPPWLLAALFVGLNQVEQRLAAEPVMDEIDARRDA